MDADEQEYQIVSLVVGFVYCCLGWYTVWGIGGCGKGGLGVVVVVEGGGLYGLRIRGGG